VPNIRSDQIRISVLNNVKDPGKASISFPEPAILGKERCVKEAGIKVGPDCGPGRIRSDQVGLGRIFRKFRNIRIFREMLLTQMEVCILSRVIYGFHLFPSTKLTLRNLINF
jgi:hypothetical protein